jgi:GT2 family glycosyltransferase
MDISVVIVGWNARHYLELCLESLEAALPRRTMEVFVVDNASSDGSGEMVQIRFPWVKLIRSEENLGFAKGNNVALRQCQGQYICLVNPDVRVFPGCLDALADFLDENPKVGFVGPRVLNADMTQQITCRHFPTIWNNFCSAMKLAGTFKKSRFFTGEQMFYFSHDRTLAVDVLGGCFLMVKRETFDTVGLMDEGFFMYGDDLDWCRRCWNAGWQVVFFPGAQAIHDNGAITKPYPVRFAVAQQRSILFYWVKYHGQFARLGIRGILFSHHIIRYLVGQLSRMRRSSRLQQIDARTQVAKACLRALISERAPHRA